MITLKSIKEEIKHDGLTWCLISFIFMLYIIGMNCNFIVIEANKGMPVYLNYSYEDAHYFSFNNFDDVKYPYLADIFLINRAEIFPGIFSIGDVLLASGVLLSCMFIAVRGKRLYFQIKSRKKK